jgi:NADH dehydrogenase
VPAAVVYTGGKLIGTFTGDVMITRDELRGLMADLLHTDSPPAAPTKLTTWAAERADQLGWHYASELARRIDRTASYEELTTGTEA